MTAPVIERFMARVYPEPNTGCWLWGGPVNRGGYGVANKAIMGSGVAHRVSWFFRHGAIPAGLVLDHKCRVRSCVNPDHLRLVTKAVNALENSEASSAFYAARTACHRCGGELITKRQDGRPTRRCVKCYRKMWNRRDKTVRQRERQKNAARQNPVCNPRGGCGAPATTRYTRETVSHEGVRWVMQIYRCPAHPIRKLTNITLAIVLAPAKATADPSPDADA